jgi:hypothetical protein
MPHYEFFCTPARKHSRRSWLLLTMRKVELPVHAAAPTMWSNAGLLSPSLPPRKAPDGKFEGPWGMAYEKPFIEVECG